MASNKYVLEKWVYGIMVSTASGNRKEIIDEMAESIKEYNNGGCAFHIKKNGAPISCDSEYELLTAAEKRLEEITKGLDEEIDSDIEKLRKKNPETVEKLVTALDARRGL